MARIIYAAFPDGEVQGGQKMILRHVEALRDLGFDALYVTRPDTVIPAWVEHRVKPTYELEIRDGDVVVAPEDAGDLLGRLAGLGARTVVFVQNPYLMAVMALKPLEAFAADSFPTFMCVGRRLEGLVQRLYPQAATAFVPCFADERLFRPAAEKAFQVAYSPKKRLPEIRAIHAFFSKLYPQHAELGWKPLRGRPEAEVARTFGASALHMSLSRLESVGMTTLEALAAGCVCAGFLGIGGEEYGTPENGFWVPDDDCVAAADALAQASELVRAGGAELDRRIAAGRETASQWSYAVFRERLEETWMRLAPQARLRGGPLD